MGKNNENLVRDIYQKWKDENPNGPRDWQVVAPRIDDECICRVLVDELLHEERFAPLFIYLEDELSALGMQFYSPGGSIQRRVWVLLGELFGLRDKSEYIKHSTVMVGLDLLANEIVARCHDARGAS
jgi:hypothetical protein